VAGFTARPEVLEPLVGRRLPPFLYQMSMLGHRLLVARDTRQERSKGGIYIPRTTQEADQMSTGAGWVVAVGPLVGSGNAPHPVGLLCENPWDILAKHIFFFAYSGQVFKTSSEDREFISQYMVTTDRDIQSVDLNPEVYQPKELDDECDDHERHM
jgi:co-chaperonin GroES (HSP10)